MHSEGRPGVSASGRAGVSVVAVGRASASESGDGFDVVRVREEVESAHPAQLVAVPGEEGEVAGEGDGVAGHVDHLGGREGCDGVDDLTAGTGPGRVEDDRRSAQPRALRRGRLAGEPGDVPLDAVGDRRRDTGGRIVAA